VATPLAREPQPEPDKMQGQKRRAAVQRRLRLRRSSIALFALILAGCSTEADRQAPQPGATQQAWEQFKVCAQRVTDKPEYAALQVHTVNLDTMQPTMAQLTDETIPSEQDARLFAARFDNVNSCRESFLMAVSIPRPDLAPVLADQFTQSGAIALLVVEQKVTWAEAARRALGLWNDTQRKIAAANLEWIADLNPFRQPTMAQIQAAAAGRQAAKP
jgi:hypothetical protein